MQKGSYAAYAAFIFMLSSCAAPRVLNMSGKTTPKGSIVAGASYTGNLPTRTAQYMGAIAIDNVKALARKDTITIDDNFKKINKAAIAQSVDPLGSGIDFYLRYGVARRADVGYKRSGLANVLTGQYQFIGPSGTQRSDASATLYGSIGLQYSWQSYKLPSVLADLQSHLGYAYKRRDLLVPLIFSLSFGPDEEYGSASFGLAYGYSFIRYSTLPDKILNDKGLPIASQSYRHGFSSVGAFFNIKAGYKYIYLIPAMSVFYQNYGTYKMLDGSEINFTGFTFIPSLSLQVRIEGRKKN